jgi:arsenate reductase (thioredoxin)
MTATALSDARAAGPALEVARGLADPLRWRIVELLAGEQLCVAHLTDELGVGQPPVSHHLKPLRTAGLVSTDRYRYWTYYRLHPDALRLLADHLDGLARAASNGTACRRAVDAQAPPTAAVPTHPEEAGPCPSAIKEVPEVLFVCVHNAGRSQMAAALLDHHARGKVHVRSAGSDPGDQINPAVVAAMDEWGIDLSQEFPKPLTDEFVTAADAVITMGCGDACPIYPGKRYEDWTLDDPAGQPVEVVRRIRDDLDLRVQQLLAELVPARA